MLLFSVEKYGETTAVQKKVLIVDDSPAEIKLLQSLLEKEGYWPVGLNDPKRVELRREMLAQGLLSQS